MKIYVQLGDILAWVCILAQTVAVLYLNRTSDRRRAWYRETIKREREQNDQWRKLVFELQDQAGKGGAQ